MSAERANSQERELKERLVKTARMHGMCQKAGFSDPMLPTSLALAAFEEMTLEEAGKFVQVNRVNIEDMSWALTHSGSAEEFEEKLRERLASMQRRPGQAGGSR